MSLQGTLVLAVIGMVVALPVTGLAAPIDVLTLTQLMIEDQGGDTNLLGLAFGIDPSSPITFSSDVNLSTTSYSYVSLPGSMYLGQSLTITASGVFNPMTSTVTVQSSITLGTTTFSTAGTTVIDLDDDPKTDDEKKEIKPPIYDPVYGKLNDYHNATLEFPGGRTTDEDYYTLDGVAKTPPVKSDDDVNVVTGNWTFDQGGAGVEITTVGFSPLTGGTGSFTTTVSATPNAITKTPNNLTER